MKKEEIVKQRFAWSKALCYFAGSAVVFFFIQSIPGT